MITLIFGGIGLLVLVAIVVGVLDARQAPEWREIAAERRARWEAKADAAARRRPARRPPADGDESWDED
jgi:hypothetical protein